MPEVELRATRDFSYSTRRLKAGDTFTVPEKMAKVLVGIKKAEYPRPRADIPAPSPALAQRIAALDHDGNGRAGGSTGAADHMRALRAEYERVVGKRPFSGWDEATLREKMAAAGK